MRCFIAINLPQNLRTSLAKSASGFSSKVKSIRAIKPESIHLTLKFLGEVKESDIGVIEQTLSRISQNHSSFSLQIHGVGAFPDMRRPSVV
ncbi:MAG: RNA 2',3'-cyclic phosphodiesterase, partial [Nitrospiraceae bacterium]|nr:RNA 2',3'-cyclic phosphodiesterase [Nitrospiraceae bacterium]